MHLQFCFLLALTLPLTWAQDKNCACEFTKQMFGYVSLYVGRLQSRYSKFVDYFFEVDLDLQKAKIYNQGRPSYYMDYTKKTLYTLESDVTKTPRCTYSDLPDIYRLPSCVPSGLKVRYNQRQGGHLRDPTLVNLDVYSFFKTNETTGPYSFLKKGEGVDYRVIHNSNPCQVKSLLDSVEVNSTAARFYIMGVDDYVINSTNVIFPSAITCVPGNFPFA